MSIQAPIVIVGTGLSGYSLVRELRKQDKKVPVVLVTADDGTSYSKPMLSTGFTKGKTAGDLAQATASAMAEQLDFDIRTHAVLTGIDTAAHELRIGEERLAYSKLVLAWGADVVKLDIPGDAQGRFFSINDLADYRTFREALGGCRRVAVMGAGLIGCEFANDLRSGGYEVAVIAPSDNVMPGLLPAVAADAVRDALTEIGVEFHLNTVVDRVDRNGEGVMLHLANGDSLTADVVISAVGLKPRTELAQAAGLDVNHGICVNRSLETSAPDVYALGDCAEVDGHVLLYVLPLMACARALAKTLLGTPSEVSYGVMPVMVKTPCCPTTAYPPPVSAVGEWECQRDGQNVRAVFRDTEGQILGFAVTGDYVLEKQALAKQVPPLHA
ncbi:MAG: FAD-dependent oxidoreductase [Oleiphilaceae bacterium]|nr:FAD-dependent oxidoreductase [Oleiphilaceae bacterium]